MEWIKGRGKTAGSLLRALVLAFGLTIVLLMIMALILLKLQPDMSTTETGILLVYILSCFGGGWYCGRKAGQKKFLWGLLTGILYFAILCAVSGMSGQSFQAGLSQSLIALLLCACGGMVGGMLA